MLHDLNSSWFVKKEALSNSDSDPGTKEFEAISYYIIIYPVKSFLPGSDSEFDDAYFSQINLKL